MRLARAAEAGGYRVEVFEAIGSTNDEAMRRAREGDAGRLWIVGREQTGGRGRLGRAWTSPRGNLYASLLLVDPSPQQLAPQLGFVAGLSLIGALRPLIGNDPLLAIKWPNDLLFDGAKLAGILLEGARLSDGRFACVIGFGVNCASHPDGMAYPATDLISLGASCTAEDAFEALSSSVVLWLQKWAHGDDFGAIRQAWLANAAGVGGPIRVSLGSRTMDGVFQSIDEHGRLMLATRDGMQIIEAGDVFVLGGRSSSITAGRAAE